MLLCLSKKKNCLINIYALIFVFQEFDFHVRWPGVKLLTALLKNQGVQVQGIILVSPMGELFLSMSDRNIMFCISLPRASIHSKVDSSQFVHIFIILKEQNAPSALKKIYNNQCLITLLLYVFICRCFQIDGPIGRLQRSHSQ